jgi:hypothetical protein
MSGWDKKYEWFLSYKYMKHYIKVLTDRFITGIINEKDMSFLQPFKANIIHKLFVTKNIILKIW